MKKHNTLKLRAQIQNVSNVYDTRSLFFHLEEEPNTIERSSKFTPNDSNKYERLMHKRNIALRDIVDINRYMPLCEIDKVYNKFNGISHKARYNTNPISHIVELNSSVVNPDLVF